LHRIKDRLLLGLIAGFGANLIKEAIAETGLRTGLSKYTCKRMIPLVLLNKKEATTWKGKVLGATTDFVESEEVGPFLGLPPSARSNGSYGFPVIRFPQLMTLRL